MKAECHQWRRSSDQKSCISPQNKFAFPPQKFRITGITASTAEAQSWRFSYKILVNIFTNLWLHRLTESWDSLAVAPVSVLFGHFEPRFYPRTFFQGRPSTAFYICHHYVLFPFNLRTCHTNFLQVEQSPFHAGYPFAGCNAFGPASGPRLAQVRTGECGCTAVL